MKGILRPLIAALPRYRRNQRGSASVEFAVAFPFLCFFLFGFGEVGTMTTRAVMLERGLDIAVRDVRIGNIPTGIDTADQLSLIKTSICREAFLLASCFDELVIDMRAIPLGGNIPDERVQCVERTPDEITPPDTTIELGTAGEADNELMLVRACVVVNPVFPFAGWFAGVPLFSSDGTTISDYALFAQTAFLNESRN